MPRGTPIDWSGWLPLIVQSHSAGDALQATWLKLRAAGFTRSSSTLSTYMTRTLGLYSYGERHRVPEPVERKRAKNRGYRRPPASLHGLGIFDFDKKQSRECRRPRVGQHTSLTGRLMGDPPPGRTQWSG